MVSTDIEILNKILGRIMVLEARFDMLMMTISLGLLMLAIVVVGVGLSRSR